LAICSSCSIKITVTKPIASKSKPVVSIFVQIIISALDKVSKEFIFKVLFFTLSVSNLKIYFFGKIFFKAFSICSVQTQTFKSFSESQLSHFCFNFSLYQQIWQIIDSQ